MGIINHLALEIAGNNSGHKIQGFRVSEMYNFDVLTALAGPKLDKRV